MKNNGQFKIKISQIKYKNPWIEVQEDKVIHPNGKSGIFGIVKMIDGVSVLPIDDNGNVYLTDEFHYAIGKRSIEVVSGGTDKGETPLAAAKRELLEESGIEAKTWVNLGMIDPFTTLIKSSDSLFLAKNLSFGKVNNEDSKNIKIIKVKFEKAVKMVMDSQITHSASCVLILKVKDFLERGK